MYHLAAIFLYFQGLLESQHIDTYGGGGEEIYIRKRNLK